MRKWLKDRLPGVLENAIYDWGGRLIAWGWPFLAAIFYWILARLGKIDWHWWVNVILLTLAIVIMVIGIVRTRPKKKSRNEPNDQEVAQWIEARFPRRGVLVDDR